MHSCDSIASAVLSLVSTTDDEFPIEVVPPDDVRTTQPIPLELLAGLTGRRTRRMDPLALANLRGQCAMRGPDFGGDEVR